MTTTFNNLGINSKFKFNQLSQASKQSASNINPFAISQKQLSEDVFVNSKAILKKHSASPLSFLGKIINDITDSINSYRKANDNSKLSLYKHDLISKLISELNEPENSELEATISLLGKLKDKEAIPHLINMLESEDLRLSVAKEVVMALSNFNNFDAYQAIIDVLNDENIGPELRATAAKSLGNIDNRRASKPLFDALNNIENDTKIRVQAALSLAKFPSIRNNEELISRLEDSSPEVRAAATKSLGIINHRVALGSIVSLLSDTNSSVICSAVDAIGNMKAEECADDLIKLLKTTNNTITSKTLKALKNLDYDCKDKLNEALSSSRSSVQRKNIIKAIGVLNYKDLAPQLITIANDLTEKPETIKETISCLVKLNDPKARELFENTAINLDNDSSLRKIAIIGISKLAQKDSLDSLLKLLKVDFNEETRTETLKAIRNIAKNEPELIKSNFSNLLQELNTDNKRTKGIVLDIIGLIKATEYADVLVDILNSPEDNDLRGMAAKIIGELEIQDAKESLYEVLLYEPHSSLTTQVAISLHNLGEKDNLYKLLNDVNSTKSAKKSIVSGLITLGDDSNEIKNYLKPGLNVRAIHNLGITGDNIQIAIIDKPVDLTHPEFEDRVVIKTLAHGTEVAGNAAGKTTGVAPKAQILSYDAFNDKNVGLDEIIEKIVEEKLDGKNDVKIINLSLGYEAKFHNNRGVMKEVKRCHKAINLANKAGISVVIASGNEGNDPRVMKDNIGTMNLLAFNEKALVVGATDTNGTPDYMPDDKRAVFSSYPLAKSERQIDVMAPGFNIELPYPGGSYKVVNGTSFATPFTSGLIALMYEVNPNLTPDQVKDILNENTMKLKAVPSYKQGNGEVIPYKVVCCALRLVDKVKADQLEKDIEKSLNQMVIS